MIGCCIFTVFRVERKKKERRKNLGCPVIGCVEDNDVFPITVLEDLLILWMGAVIELNDRTEVFAEECCSATSGPIASL